MVEAATNAQIKEIFERNERTVRSDRRKKTVGKAELWVTELDALLERIRTAEAREARLSEALRGIADAIRDGLTENELPDHRIKIGEGCRIEDGFLVGPGADTIRNMLALMRDLADAALSGSGSGWQNPLEHAVEFVAKMAWRTDPPNANNKLTDTERLSAIKYHPTIKGYAKPHIELAEREAASPSTAGER